MGLFPQCDKMMAITAMSDGGSMDKSVSKVQVHFLCKLIVHTITTKSGKVKHCEEYVLYLSS